MPGSPDTRPAPDLPEERRLALVVATETYDDESLRRLRAPGHDAQDLRDLLADPEIGGFTVTSVLDGTAQSTRIAVSDFLADLRPDDLILVYLSCHGLVDLRRRLYFAARDTTKERLSATGVEASWLLDQLEDSRARRQVVILDCCFSGAFATGAKGDDDLGLGERFHGQGRGRVVLTASRESEYSFEGRPVAGQAVPGSVFTGALVQGIRSGAADLDHDGYVSVDDAYRYAFDAVQASDVEQTPQRWFYGAEGEILLARSPAGVDVTAAELPDGIAAALSSPYPSVRTGGVEALSDWLADDDPTRVVAAEQALALVADNDRPEVAGRARELLATTGERHSGRSGPDPSGFGGSTDGSPAPTPRLASHRSWVLAGALAAVLVGIGGVVWFTRAESGGQDPTGTAWVSSDGGKERILDISAPWRLTVSAQGDTEDGCEYTVTNTETDDQIVSPVPIYGVRRAQVQMGGRLRLWLDDAACLAQIQEGAGTRSLPFTNQPGDTEGFYPRGALVAVEAIDFFGNSDCDLVLREATTGTEVSFATATLAQTTVELDPGASDYVYVEAGYCAVSLSEQSP